MRQVREAVPGEQALRAEGARLLRDALPPALRKPLLRVQPGQSCKKILDLFMDLNLLRNLDPLLVNFEK